MDDLEQKQRKALAALEQLEKETTHPWDLETPEQRAQRILAQADQLEWEFKRRSCLGLRVIQGEGLPDADTQPGEHESTVRRRIVRP